MFFRDKYEVLSKKVFKTNKTGEHLSIRDKELLASKG